MPPSDALGLGGQSVEDFLSLSDVPTLRKKYYEQLQGGLDSAAQPAQPDQQNLLWQGIVPTLATALLTKGKSLAFSGAPATAVLASEQKRADDQQNLNINAKLKGAGLIGDEIQRKETLAVNSSDKADALAERERANKANEKNDALRIAEMATSHADSVAERNLTQQALQEQRKTSNDLQSSSTVQREIDKMTGNLDTQITKQDIAAKTAALKKLKGYLNNPNIGSVESGEIQNIMGRLESNQRISEAEIKRMAPHQGPGIVNATLNMITGGTLPTLSPQQLKEIKENVLSVATQSVGESLHGLVNQFSNDVEANQVIKKYGNPEEVKGLLHNRLTTYLSDGGAEESAGAQSNKSFTFKNSADPSLNGKSATLDQLKKSGWTDDQIQQAQQNGQLE